MKLLKFLAFLCLALLMESAFAMPRPDEERYIDKEYNRELLNWLNGLKYTPQYTMPCKYYGPNGLNGPMPKRNSELINSLLSLPKNMNDAGK